MERKWRTDNYKWNYTENEWCGFLGDIFPNKPTYMTANFACCGCGGGRKTMKTSRIKKKYIVY